MSDIFFAPLKVPLTDASGLMSREWYLFFQAMFLRVGGTSAPSNDDLQLLTDVEDATDDGLDVRSLSADLERAISMVDDPIQSTDDAQALAALSTEDPVIGRFTAQWDGLTPASGGGTVSFLRADGVWTVPAYPTVPVGANPSASVGLAAVNGAAATFMRSDGAPALSQSIIPTWTGPHTFTASIAVTAAAASHAADFTGVASQYTARITAGAGAGTSFGLDILAGTNGSDQALRVLSQDTTRQLLLLLGNGSLTVGNSTDNAASTFAGTGVVTFNGDVKVVGKSGFNNTAPISKPTVTGSRAANAALASLLTALANYGLVVDSST